MCGNREADSAQFTGPESECVRKCLNGNAKSYARRRKGSGNKTGKSKEGGRGRLEKPEKMRDPERPNETGKAKGSEAENGY